ncbi:MAG: ATP-dependent RNA helicase [Flavobacteriales bacterium CG_4_10_14_0_2_um_filter_32_8]|nr:MAG: ATP-dependent RNA helicase [Flavobacteriales bacterium CG_4_10_14_0_2_um_filter_32_8]
MKFTEFGFEPPIIEALDAMGFDTPTPIQEQAIPAIMQNKDVIACAQTGTGKTAAFVLPILNAICKRGGSEKVSTIVIVPTRELAMQIDQQVEGLSYFTNATSIAIYGGGDGQSFDSEKKALTTGADIVICTPGRFISHLSMGYFDTSGVKHFILDEADRMLDMGFNEDISRIAEQLPKERQNLMFSATMPPKIRQLSNQLLKDPITINVAISKPNEGILQAAYLVHNNQKIALIKHLLKGKDHDFILVFSSRKSSVKEITAALNKQGMPAKSIHSDLNQQEREAVLLDFKNKKIQLLVATDVLSRGIDIQGINLVINYDIPSDAEDYVHRIGRTARGDNTGVAITFINADECYNFSKIEKLIEKEVHKLALPEGFEEGPKYDTTYRKPFKGKKNFSKKGNWSKKPAK